ncbi:MAG: hypothetical protein HY235_13245 [Acidobacteria bacterium]|nr:hypothetical protein [Acidobacteriota bacterium]
MKLSDLRRLAVRKQLRVHFAVAGAMECVVNEHGVVQVPQLQSIPEFNVEESLSSVSAFRIDALSADSAKARPQSVSLQDLEKMIASLSPGTPAAADHDE